MKFKKILASAVSAVCSASVITAFPEFTQKTFASEVVNNSFEQNYDGWYGNADNVSLIAENGKGFNGSRGMTVSGRSSASQGASSSKGFYVVGGIEHNYSMKVFSEKDQTFHLTLLYISEETGIETTVELAEKKVKGGEWTEISADYKAPANTYEFRLSLSTDSIDDFSFDDVVITAKEMAKASAVPAGKGLKDEFANYFRVGNILNGGTVKNSAITATMLKDHNAIECENETKPDATLVQNGSTNTNIKVSLNSCAAIADFCVQNNIAFRGHTFVWHSQTPSWFFKDNFQNNGNWVSPAVMDQRLESYIKNMFNAFNTQYPALNIYSYDVCNECISDDENRTKFNGGARYPGDNNVEGGKSAWVQVYGDNSFVEHAFTYAKKYAPKSCELYYNDYNEYWGHKRDSIYNMCKSLYQKGLLDGVGMQSHINANYEGFSGVAAYVEAMKKYLSIGCNVQITELDISTEGGTYSLNDQANKYKAIFQAAVDWNTNPQSDGRVTLVQVWGPNDNNSWVGTDKKTGKPNSPLLYDGNNQPKLAYNAITSIIPDSQWGDGSKYQGSGNVTPIEIKPNDYGWYFQHGFEGTLNDWSARGPAEILTSGRTAYVGNESLLVMNRTASWNGASFALNSNIFKPGTAYSFSANVNYFDGNPTDTFYMKLQYTDANGDTQYSTIAEATGYKGQWVQIANSSYTIPSDASNMQLYIETAKTTNNFYIDEVIGAVDGTGILGAKPEIKEDDTPQNPSSLSLGDANGDGKINVYDMTIARKGLINGFASVEVQNACDVDQSGKVDVTDLILLQKYILGQIKEFPVAERVIDVTAMAQAFSSVTPASSYKKEGENNPLYTQRFGADPGVMEYNGRMYVYMTDDTIEYKDGKVAENGYGLIKRINCISSDDMVNWTDHGAIPVAGSDGIAKFASNSWAPCAAHKTINGKEKFFLYFCNGGNGVCVLTADSPTGPWTSPLNGPLVSRSVANCGNIPWLFDPAVFVDKDGTGYLAFGGGVPDGKQAMPSTTRIVKLSDDMIHLDGTPVTIDAPYVFEDSGINRIGNKYYYTYCSNWNTGGNQYGLTNAGIQYMVADNPLGPYKYGGEFFKNQGNFFPGMTGNNHHSIGELNGQLYLFYHSRPVEKAMGIDGNYRSPQVDKITMNGDKIGSVTGTMSGIAQLKSLSPYQTVQAETMSNQSNDISVTGLGNTVVSGKKGSWIKASGVNFTSGAKMITVKASSSNGGIIKVCTGKADGEAIAYIEVSSSMSEVTVPVIKSPTGSNDLYFVFSGDINFDSWSFK